MATQALVTFQSKEKQSCGNIHQELNESTTILGEMLFEEQTKNPRTVPLTLSVLAPLTSTHTLPSFKLYTAPFSPLFAYQQNQKGQVKPILKHQLKELIKTNSFTSIGGILEQNQVKSHSLFPAASFFNHSCEPNLHHTFVCEDSSIIMIRAARDIQEGEELTITYLDLLLNLKERQDILKIKFGF